MKAAARPWSRWLTRLFSNPALSKMAVLLNRLPLPGKEILLRVQGSLMAARSWDRAAALLLWKFSWAEAEESAALRLYSRPGMVAVDIGANIGFHTLQLSRWAQASGKVYAFEPDPDNFELLKRNVAANSCGNVICLRKAVADQTGAASLFLNPYNRGDHRLYGSHQDQPALAVEAVALDDFLRQEARVDVVKMDIQGAEYRALLGMRKLLLRSPGAVVVSELSPRLMAGAGNRVDDFLREAENLGLQPALLSAAGRPDWSLSYGEIAGFLQARPSEEITLLLRLPS